MPQPTRLVAGVAAAALAVSLAACSSSGGHAKASTTPSTSTPPSSSASSSGFPSTSAAPTTDSATPTASDTVTATQVATALLTPTDLGLTGATSAASPSTDNALPCAADGSKSLNQQVPATVRVGVDITDDALQAALGEEIRLFADTATAQSALTIAKAGLTCTTGSLRADDGTATPAKIQAPIDIATDLAKDTKLSGAGITSALVWQATVTGANIDLAAVQLGRSLVLFTFQSATGADTSKLPNPEAVIQAGLDKIVSS